MQGKKGIVVHTHIGQYMGSQGLNNGKFPLGTICNKKFNAKEKQNVWFYKKINVCDKQHVAASMH